MPVVNGTFAFDTLVGMLEKRAVEAGVDWPKNFTLLDISLNNEFDGKDFWSEQAFWKDRSHAKLGSFVHWPLGLAGILPPKDFPERVRNKLAKSFVWKIDQVPSRVEEIRKILTTPTETPVVIYVHCSAGCDRTGEVVGSYRTHYTAPDKLNITEIYKLNCAECGRCPNYWSTTALEWFCVYQQVQAGVDVPTRGAGEENITCLNFAKCSDENHCKPTGGAALGTSKQQKKEKGISLK